MHCVMPRRRNIFMYNYMYYNHVQILQSNEAKEVADFLCTCV